MPKGRRVPVMPARGGHGQADVAAMVGCGKRDVGECARLLRELLLPCVPCECAS